jgi:hypothetical protein
MKKKTPAKKKPKKKLSMAERVDQDIARKQHAGLLRPMTWLCKGLTVELVGETITEGEPPIWLPPDDDMAHPDMILSNQLLRKMIQSDLEEKDRKAK